mmetsp:Transcript_16380/g.34275  ORF Transcript_16380/g.34275 Transcript_16380/m.34275 type:complete len:669 (-) Transcript_16380:97-2103(-)
MDLEDNLYYSPTLAMVRRAPIGFWKTCFTVFGASVTCQPAMATSYVISSPAADATTTGTFFSSVCTIGKVHHFPLYHYVNEQRTVPSFCSYRSIIGTNSNILSFWGSKKKIENESQENVLPKPKKCPRIAIIGGGIAGVTAAKAIANRANEIPSKIVVFEGDSEGGHRDVNFDAREQPVWVAATARNANSMVPGAAMHVMSQRSTLLKIMKDTTREWYSERVEQLRHWLDKELVQFRLMNVENFDVVPPYFTLHLFRCLGPSATWDERATFVTFLKNFLRISLLSGKKEADDRGSYILQLAQSNRHSFLEALHSKTGEKELASAMGLGRGFISLHRTHEGALHAAKEGEIFGERSQILPIEEAIKLEPRIANLPMKSLFAVHRLDDYTANSAIYVQDLVNKIVSMGVDYRCNHSGTIKDIKAIKHSLETKDRDYKTTVSKPLATSASFEGNKFLVTTKDGTTEEYDYVVLAAGVNSPLIARKLSAGDFCPTYPLRGYSLTLYTNHTHERDGNDRMDKGFSSNLLNRPISVDDMYCSSVGPNMARLAGFGELVGYRDKAVDVPSLAPQVMGRYARTIFPESDATDTSALQCFRPMSPDDIPIVGEVSTVPGLFLHTGHGTLGWTVGLATAECVAQALCDKITGVEDRKTFELPGGIVVDRARLSPDRFV